MAKNKRVTPRPFLGSYPVMEEYETTFSDWQMHNDRHVWQGSGDTAEFPHNPGSLEEKIDEEEDRKIYSHNGNGRGYGY